MATDEANNRDKFEDASVRALETFSKKGPFVPAKSAANVSSTDTPYLNLIRARQSLQNTLMALPQSDLPYDINVDIRQAYDADLAESRLLLSTTEANSDIVLTDIIQTDVEEILLDEGVVVDSFFGRDTSVQIDNFVDAVSFESDYIPSGSHNISLSPSLAESEIEMQVKESSSSTDWRPISPEYHSEDDCVDEGIMTNSTVMVNIGGVDTYVKGFPLSLPVASMDVKFDAKDGQCNQSGVRSDADVLLEHYMRHIAHGHSSASLNQNGTSSYHSQHYVAGEGDAHEKDRDWNFSSQPDEEDCDDTEEEDKTLTAFLWKTDMLVKSKDDLPDRARAVMSAVDVVINSVEGETRSFEDVEELSGDSDYDSS